MTETATRRKHKRPRPQTSCAVCHRRKVKCNNELPCGPCIRHGCADECRFDGLPAKSERNETSAARPSTTSTTSPSDSGHQSSTGSQAASLDADLPSFPSQRPSSPRSVEKQRSIQLLEDVSHTSKAHRGHSNVPTHDWIPQQGPRRGRTHTSWLLRTFDPLLVYLGRDTLGDDPLREDETWLNKSRSHDPLPQPHHFAGSVYDQLPPPEVCHELVARYFVTFDTIYPIVNRNIFGPLYNQLHSDPKGVPICFVIKVLVIMAIANATYPDSEKPVPKSSVDKWMDLASSLPASALEAGDIMLHTVHMFATLSLAEQILKLDATAAYIRSGTYVRTAMIVDLHRIEASNEKRRLWEAIMDLDLHASLAAGQAPASPLPEAPSPDAAMDTQPNGATNDLADVLPRSLHVRHKIVTLLNTERHLRFEQVIELSSELTRAMAPVSTESPREHQSFLYKYLSFTYGRFLAALHRPFFSLNDPALYLSRTMTTRLARQYMREIIAIYRNQAGPDPFAALLVSRGIMFRNEARQAHMVLCFELLRGDDDGGFDIHSFLRSSEEGKGSVNKIFREFFGIAESKVKKQEIPESSFLIPAMVYAHMCAIERFPRDTDGYAEALTHAALEAEGFCPPPVQSAPVVPSENCF